MTWSYADCGFEDEFDDGFLEDDGDPNAVLAYFRIYTIYPHTNQIGDHCLQEYF